MTEAVRRAIRHSQASLRALARRHGLNPKTIAKWRKRSSVADLPTGPREAHPSTLSTEQEAIIVACRRHTLLPLDDCLYALRATLPHLARSALRRCLQWHDSPACQRSKPTSLRRRSSSPIPSAASTSCIAEVSTEEGKLRLFVAIDHTSKFAPE
jgi:transposase-like protein